MSEWTQQEVQKVLNEVSRRSSVDPAFRKQCLDEPRAAVEQVTRLPIPAAFRIRFVENQGANMTIVLPDPVEAEGELSDADLEAVAGGKASNTPDHFKFAPLPPIQNPMPPPMPVDDIAFKKP